MDRKVIHMKEKDWNSTAARQSYSSTQQIRWKRGNLRRENTKLGARGGKTDKNREI